MKTLRTWLARLVGMFPSARRERDLSNEIASHLQMHIDDNLRSGMSPELARRNALLKLGGVEPVKEAAAIGARFHFSKICCATSASRFASYEKIPCSRQPPSLCWRSACARA